MKVAVFSTKSYDRTFLEAANAEYGHELVFFEPRLTYETSVLAADFPAVCVFVNDRLDAKTLSQLANLGTKLIALRSAGFNNVDLNKATELGLSVVRVPAYSPYAVAEHTVALFNHSQKSKFYNPLYIRILSQPIQTKQCVRKSNAKASCYKCFQVLVRFFLNQSD